jgi:hypothetical protein
MDANDMWIRFLTIMNEATELILHKCGTSRKNVQWMNRKAWRARKNKVRLGSKYKESQTFSDWIEYKKVSYRAVKEYKTAKKTFEKKFVNIKNNS